MNSWSLDNKHWASLAFLATCLLSQLSHAQVSGTVFRDFNADGIKQSTEPFLGGITVTAYKTDGTFSTTTSNATTGAYSFSGLALPLRIEFTGMPTGDNTAVFGTNNKTSVQFYTANNSTAHYGVIYPSDYCEANPQVVSHAFASGEIGSGTIPNSAMFSNSSTETNISNVVTQNTRAELGAVWGIAYNRVSQKVFSAAFLKRHTDLGPQGLGGIYVTDFSVAGTPVSNLIDLATIYSLGSIGSRGFVDGNGNGVWEPAEASYDKDAFAKIAKVGLGDIDISDDGNTLYVVDLFNKKIIKIDLTAYNTSGTLPTSANVSLLDDYLAPNFATGTDRPFGLKFYKNKLYLGLVSDGSTPAMQVQAYDLATNTWSKLNFNSSPTFNLTYSRWVQSGNLTNPADWAFKSWSDVYTDFLFGNNYYIRPQAILSDIEFDGRGNMILGIMDRSGHQFGHWNYLPIDPVPSPLTCSTIINGDVFRATVSSGGYTITNSELVVPTEYFEENSYSPEASNGGLAVNVAQAQMVVTAMDPTTFDSGGLLWFNTGTSGANIRELTTYNSSNPATFGKAAGMGDVELLCSLPPLEIGNRVWTDTDSDGIQDANETGIDGITVQLYEGSTLVGTATTANGGQWYFNNTNVTGGLKPNTSYTIRVLSSEFPSGQSLTTTNSDGTTNGDARDNDASLVGSNAEIAYTTGSYGQNDHTLDIGLRSAACAISISAIPTACNATNNSYNLAITLNYSNQPTGDISLNVGGTTYTFTPSGAGSDTYTLNGLTSDGAMGVSVSATFVGDNTCAANTTYNAPASCSVVCTFATNLGTDINTCTYPLNLVPALLNSNCDMGSNILVEYVGSTCSLFGGLDPSNINPNISSVTNYTTQEGTNSCRTFNLSNPSGAMMCSMPSQGYQYFHFAANTNITVSSLDIWYKGTVCGSSCPTLPITFEVYKNGVLQESFSRIATSSMSHELLNFADITLQTGDIFEFRAILNEICGGCDMLEVGDVTVYQSTPTIPTYAWSTGQTTPMLTVNSPGTYSVTVTDCNGCTASDQIVVSMATPPTATLNPTIGTCNGTTPNNNASISLSAVSNADAANYSIGSTYTGANYGDPSQIDVSAGSGILTGLLHNTQYTVRLFSGTTGCYADYTITTPIIDCSAPATPDLSLTKTVNTAIATLNSQVTFTLTLTNDNGITATGVVVTDQLPAGVTFVSTSAPANVSVSGSTITWNVGTFLGTDAPKTLSITVTASGEGSFVNNTEITAMNETDGDSTPNNNVTGEDDQDQACFSVPVSLCGDSPTATITVTANTATTYQWYVSTDNGASYTVLSGETNQTLTINNTLMGGNNVTKYFKVAYNGAAITDGCGNVMCCPVIVTTQTCTVCPAPKCISVSITKH